MNPYEIFNLALKGLKERKVRSALTIMMVVVGVALMTALNGMAGGFDVFLHKQISNLAPNLLIVSPEPLVRGSYTPTQSAKIILTDQTLSIIAKLPKVKEAYPAYLEGVSVIAKGQTQSKSLLGIKPEVIKKIIPSLELYSGSMLNSGQSNSVMLGYRVAFPPDGSEIKVGDNIILEYTRLIEQGNIQKAIKERRGFLVVGIFKPADQISDNMIFMDIDEAKAFLKKSSSYDRIYLLTEDVKYNEFVESRVKELYGGLISITSPQSVIKTIQELLSGWEAFVASIGGVSLIVGAIGILAALYTSVLERVREIGIMKSIGFSEREILLLYLTESTVIGILGGFLGILVGIIGGELLTERVMSILNAPPIRPVFFLDGLLYVFLIALILSILAGIYPAWRASKLDPVVALRKE